MPLRRSADQGEGIVSRPRDPGPRPEGKDIVPADLYVVFTAWEALGFQRERRGGKNVEIHDLGDPRLGEALQGGPNSVDHDLARGDAIDSLEACP